MDDCIIKWWDQVVVSNLKYTAKNKWEEVKREKALFLLTVLIFAMLVFCVYTTKSFRQNPAITEQYSNLIYSFLILSVLFDLLGFFCSPRLRPWLSCICYLISIWFLVGSFLALYDYGEGVNWVSDWINAAVALGTIGAVATSLYLANRKPDRTKFIDFTEPQKIVVDSGTSGYVRIAAIIESNVDFDIRIYSAKLLARGKIIAWIFFNSGEKFGARFERNYIIIEPFNILDMSTVDNSLKACSPFKLGETFPLKIDEDSINKWSKYLNDNSIQLSKDSIYIEYHTSVGHIKCKIEKKNVKALTVLIEKNIS